MNNKIRFVKSLILSISFSIPITALASDGSLDLNFNGCGYETTPIGNDDETGTCVAIQSDGKIVVAGYTNDAPGNGFAVVRYNANGGLDLSFNSGGIVTTIIGNGCGAASLAIQSDGKILVAGSSTNAIWYSDFTLVRYTTAGILDTSFNSTGIVTTDVGTHDDIIKSIAIQSDGKIVATGYCYDGSNSFFATARYNTNGSLDTTFDFDGIVKTTLGDQISWGYAVAIQNDGKIVITGISGNILSNHLTILRYNTDGSLDNTFDSDGKVVANLGTDYDGGNAIAIQADGKIVIGGYYEDNADDDFAVARYNTDGSPDSSFDHDGFVITSFGLFGDVGNSVEIQSEGKIVVSGYSAVGGTNNYFALARYKINGSLDSTFDTDGKVLTLFGPDFDTGYDAALQSDGKIVVVGSSTRNPGGAAQNDFAIVRYNNTVTTSINAMDHFNPEILISTNLFSHSTTISFSLSVAQQVSLKIFDARGRLITTLADRIFTVGENKLTWYSGNVDTGIYFMNLETETGSINKKFIVTE